MDAVEVCTDPCVAQFFQGAVEYHAEKIIDERRVPGRDHPGLQGLVFIH